MKREPSHLIYTSICGSEHNTNETRNVSRDARLTDSNGHRITAGTLMGTAPAWGLSGFPNDNGTAVGCRFLKW
ncbi:hypothetical protein EVAR_91082_1 [Eumeta japonica]|uniref:Uncharacterized protein n=1 Tax=Eumeta variegata TaxID=151549 RepID=A0A4C1SUR7_EUMVA|nr:hypothetical protein EVAR_91082_1 [Eumeta japonica]